MIACDYTFCLRAFVCFFSDLICSIFRILFSFSLWNLNTQHVPWDKARNSVGSLFYSSLSIHSEFIQQIIATGILACLLVRNWIIMSWWAVIQRAFKNSNPFICEPLLCCHCTVLLNLLFKKKRLRVTKIRVRTKLNREKCFYFKYELCDSSKCNRTHP